jgi:hypothetical protein
MDGIQRVGKGRHKDRMHLVSHLWPRNAEEEWIWRKDWKKDTVLLLCRPSLKVLEQISFS